MNEETGLKLPIQFFAEGEENEGAGEETEFDGGEDFADLFDGQDMEEPGDVPKPPQDGGADALVQEGEVPPETAAITRETEPPEREELTGQERAQFQQSQEALALIDRLAADSGISREKYIEAMQKMQEDQEIAAQVAQGVPETFARRLYAVEAENRRRREAEQLAVVKNERQRELMEFVNAYPDVKEFPPEVLKAISSGKKPLDAYQGYENKLLRAKIAAMEKNQANRQNTAGSLKGAGMGEEADAFSFGFDSI